MNILEYIHKDAKEAPKTIGYKLKNNLATIEDEDEACKDPKWAYLFALNVKGADIEKCQEVACKNPECAYKFAYHIVFLLGIYPMKRIRHLIHSIFFDEEPDAKMYQNQIQDLQV